ncbi:MarR family winged helix-turn-helix transcriptional regulator [Brevibacterium aurantiacum]|uniref:MarR family transcriptional regulator n=1 Tax=Brevibacterium aurantiacum TaxID=273384 RepID=A0A4Z0KHB6_BREAU|nr:MarR family transcriptional regulator [Brevibacterium aurantiacum]TGD36638.1 MarR family transcriptional regulator [Brevibacterium aurantiacum]
MDDVDSAEIVAGLVVVSSRLTRAFRRVIGNESQLVTLRALAVVEQYQPVRVGHFAQGYLCSQPAATKLLARLEGEGLVIREASVTDRRASQFSLTDAGRAKLAENRGIMIGQMEPYFESLSADERVSVHRALGLVAQYLQEQHPVDVDEARVDDSGKDDSGEDVVRSDIADDEIPIG